MEIARSKRGISVSQRKYTLDLLKETDMLGCRASNTPVELGNMDRLFEGGHVNKAMYQQLVDAIFSAGTGNVQWRADDRIVIFDLQQRSILGNSDKLSKMMKIAEVKNDVMGQFHDALYLGDVEERLTILENAGHLPLAYITASVHGFQETAQCLAAQLGDNVPSIPQGKTAKPVICGGDCPLLMVSKGIFQGGFDNAHRGAHEDYEEAADADWGEALDIGEMDNLQNGDISLALEDEVREEENEEGGWDLEDLDLPHETDTPKTATNMHSVFVAPTPGMPVSQIWVQKSSLAAEHAAPGNFDTAMRLLSGQLGIKNFSPLKSLFIDLHMGSHSYLGAFSSVPVISIAIERGWTESASTKIRGPPSLVFGLSQLEEKIKGSLAELGADASGLLCSPTQIR
ncbi:vesicle coat protein [Lithospermum erythrorhizon]|uniref:Vesicle coat protein n=1 Tax=Lithospermum erythrorhizon TaxID=34254 RepID=A0AAV3NN53_LITER